MNSRTWNLNLKETDTHPATTIKGLSQEDASKVLRGLMYGPQSPEYTYVEAAVRAERVDRHEGPLAA